MATCQELEEGEYSDCQSDDLFLQASQMYDESLTDVSNDADDLLLLQASQIYEDSLLDADPSLKQVAQWSPLALFLTPGLPNR